jgi:hypothetical protein
MDPSPARDRIHPDEGATTQIANIAADIAGKSAPGWFATVTVYERKCSQWRVKSNAIFFRLHTQRQKIPCSDERLVRRQRGTLVAAYALLFRLTDSTFASLLPALPFCSLPINIGDESRAASANNALQHARQLRVVGDLCAQSRSTRVASNRSYDQPFESHDHQEQRHRSDRQYTADQAAACV